jgi:hypothetical protein
MLAQMHVSAQNYPTVEHSVHTQEIDGIGERWDGQIG